MRWTSEDPAGRVDYLVDDDGVRHATVAATTPEDASWPATWLLAGPALERRQAAGLPVSGSAPTLADAKQAARIAATSSVTLTWGGPTVETLATLPDPAVRAHNARQRRAGGAR